MPFNNQSGRFERVWNFVDQRETGDDITRTDLDVMANDLAAGITEAAAQTLNYVGEWNPETASFPASRPSGGRIMARDAFVCLGDGTVGGITFEAGETLVALVPDPGQVYATRWLKLPFLSLAAMMSIADAAQGNAAAVQQIAADFGDLAGAQAGIDAAVDLAQRYAQTPEDTTVPGGAGYSALHYAAKAGADALATAADRVQTGLDRTAAALSAEQAALYDGPRVDDVEALRADTTLTYVPGGPGSVVPGDLVRATVENYVFEVLPADVTGDEHTSGGVEADYRTGPKEQRRYANVRGRVNFFDFLQTSRSSAVREQISNSTFDGDLAVELTAFRDALQTIQSAGGRPHGFIPEARICTSAEVNFAMDYLTLETQGQVHFHGLGEIPGFIVDGSHLGVNGYGTRLMNVGKVITSTEAGLMGGKILTTHQCDFAGIQSLGGVTAGLVVSGCVSSVFRMVNCQNQNRPFMPERPAIGLWITGGDGSDPLVGYNSWCTFESPILEYCETGIRMDHSYGNILLGGTSEGNIAVGINLQETALYNKFIGIDLEGNAEQDFYCFGHSNDFISMDTQVGGWFLGGASRNRLIGGKHGHIQFGDQSQLNLLASAEIAEITDHAPPGRNRREKIVTIIGGNWAWHDAPIVSAAAVAASSGTITSGTAFVERAGVGGEIQKVTVNIIDNGTGSGEIRVTLPFASGDFYTLSGQLLSGDFRAVTGWVGAGSDVLHIRAADGSYPISGATDLILSGSIRP